MKTLTLEAVLSKYVPSLHFEEQACLRFGAGYGKRRGDDTTPRRMHVKFYKFILYKI